MKYHHLVLFFILTIASIASAMDNTSYSITTMPTATKQRFTALIYCFQQKTLKWPPLLCIEEILNHIDDCFHPLTKSDLEYIVKYFDPYTQKFNINNEQPTDHDDDLLEQHREKWNKKYPVNPYNLKWAHQPYEIDAITTDNGIEVILVNNGSKSWALRDKKNTKNDILNRYLGFVIEDNFAGQINHVIDNRHIVSKYRNRSEIQIYYLEDKMTKDGKCIFRPIEHARFPLGTRYFLLENGILSYVSTKHDTTPETNIYHMKIIYPKKYLHNASIQELQTIKTAIEETHKSSTETAPKKPRRLKKITQVTKKLTKFKKRSKK